MASSTFRGRRVVDPIPLQRDSLPRDRKYPSSFSDLAAAWENVGEVKSALQAAEARINEANAGLGSEVEQNGEVDVSLQEVFSERQRYGRVARYELRPSRFGQAASSVPSFGEDQINSRRVPDFPLNINRPSESSTRAPVHTPLLSPPSKDSHDKVQNGGFSRNRGPSYSAHPAETEVRDPGVATAYSSLYTANDPLGRRPPIRLYGNTLSTIPSASSFEDSLEIGESSSRVRRNEACSTSSLGLRPTIANNSDALARLKERIKQQKEQASRLSPTDTAQGNGSSNPSPPPEQRPSVRSVDSTTAADSYRADVDVPVRTAGVISKRKVASAPAAPAYKGFSEVESKTTVLSEVNRKVKRKDPATHKLITKPANQRPQKPITKKGPPKVQRVIAPRRPTDIITTSSWRSGQQTVKRILGPARKKSSSPEGSRPQSRSSQGTDISEPKSLNFQWREEADGKKHAGVGDGSEKGGAPTDEVPRVTSPTNQKLVNGLKKDSGSDSELSWEHSSGHAKESVRDAEKDVKDLKGNKILSTEAKNILSDLELDTDDESDKEMKKPVAEPKHKQTIVNKPSSTSRRKRPLNSQSQGPPVSSYPPRQKVRHYDTDEVKKYIEKQIAERKKKLHEDRLLKERAVKEKKQKLEELYSRQKKNLHHNLNRKSKKCLGETYSKGHSDFRSIIYPYNHPFPQDEVEHYSEDTGVSESDKENLDIASFRGLPAYPSSQERNGHNVSSSPSEFSEDGSMSPVPARLDVSEDQGRVPCVTSVSVGAKPVDIRPSAYVGFPEEKSGDDVKMTRHDMEPRSNSPTRLGTISSAGNGELRPMSSPPREDRIAAIKQTAAELKHRLESEAWRLGLNLQATGLGKIDEQQPLTSVSSGDYTVFKGALPGVGNLQEQAELNEELDNRTSAATTIQAAFRGHSVRQGLNWKLPSGRTLRSTVRQGLHQRSGILGTGASESSQYSTAWDNDDKSSISDINTSYSSARSKVKSPTHSSRSLKDGRSSSTRSPSLLESERRKHAQGRLSKHSLDGKPSVLPWTSKGGDSLSVINIFTRRNPHLKSLAKEDKGAKEQDSEIASLLEETLPDSKAGETASLLEPPADLDQSKELLEQTLVEQSPRKSKEHEYEDDFEGSSRGSRQEESVKRTPSPVRKKDDHSYSETFESPERKTGSLAVEESLHSPDRSMESGTLSPTLSEGELSRASEADNRSSTMSSVRQSPTRDQSTHSSVPLYTPKAHPPPSVFMPAHQGGDCLSPGSLDMRLTAELNRLEYMEESVRQLTDVERTRAVSLAQQETVSLAQILKSKQLSHAREMENLRAKAREEALEAAKQLEEARRAAADAAAGAAETIARMRLEAAATITESADRLVKVQTEAARTTSESAKQVEEARTSAARTLLDVAKQQTTDTRGVAAEAASAAAEAAVKASMSRFYEQQEQLLKEREARLKSYSDRSRNERSRDSYSSYSKSEHTDSYSRTRSSRSGTDAMDRGSPARSTVGTRTYASDEFSRASDRDKTASVHTASNLTVDRSVTRSQVTPTPSGSKHTLPAGEETGSIPEEMDHSVADSVVSDVGLDVAEDDSLAEVLTGDSLKKPSERLERSPEVEDYTLNFEESVISSHTATDDEIDFRMILPSESHRRRSLGTTGRRGSIGSDQGTVSYSSDDNHESDFAVDKMLEDVSAAPFSGEDSFTQFTSEMVRLMKEEEVRAKHQAGLLRLREKAVKEKTRAEMAWLESQKRRHRDKGADDVMPSIRKRQRGVLMRLQAEQAEIKRLKAANRAASYERRLLLMQQEEIARLRKNTKKIRDKATTEQTTPGQQERGENLTATGQDSGDQVKSEAESTEIPEEFEDKPGDQSTRSRSVVSEDVKTVSPSASHSASIAEALPSYQSPGASRSESRPTYESARGDSASGERKRPLSEGDSDEGSARDGPHSAAKDSPTASDSTIMQKLKKLKSQSGEKYLTLREQKLMKRRREAENLLEDKKKLLEWEKRLDKEESLVRNLLNEALKLESSRNRSGQTSFTSEEEEHKDRSGRTSASPSSKTIDKDRYSQGTESVSESIKATSSRAHERSASESSVPEDISASARDKSHDSGRSRESSIPEVYMKTQSHGGSIPEEIPEEYGNDTFESLDSTVTPAHSTPVRSDLSFKKDTSPSMSRKSSNDGSKSEEETSMTETSDHSDIESRVRRLRDQLEVRKREVKRLYNERKKQRKAMLRAQEASLRQELQAVEMVISRTKAELNRPQTDSKRPETGSVDQQNSKSDTSDTTPSREIRYSLSRTSDAGSRRKISPSEKLLTVSARSELAREKGSSATEMDTSGRSERTISEVPSLKDKDKDLSSSIQEEKSLGKSETSISKNIDLEPAAKTRKADEQISRKVRQTLENENKASLREQQASQEAEIEDEAKTADDLSISKDSVARTASKASRLENISQGSSKLFSVSRGSVSDSDAKSSIKTVEDLSVSEGSEIRTKSSRSESSIGDSSRKSIPKKTKNDMSEQSSLAGERKRTVSDASKSSRHSKSPLMNEKSRSSRQVYSSSFESVQDEGDRTEDDISEHISIEERVQSSEAEDSIRDERESSEKRDESKDFERTRDISDAQENVVIVKDENSEIEEQLPSTERTTSVFGNNRTTTQNTEHSQEKDQGFLRPEVNEDQFPSYSTDFEPSALDETDDGKSDNLKPDASYTPDFEERDDSVRSQAKGEDFSFPAAQGKSHSELSAGDKKTLSQGKLERGKLQLSEDHKVPKVPSLALEQATDEESVVEELGESHDDAYEVTDKEDSSLFFEKNDLQRIENNEVSVSPVVHSDVPGAPGLRDVLSAEQTAGRIAEGLSAMLLAESVNCVTHMFEKRRQVAEDVTKTHGDVGEKKEQNDRTSFKNDKDFFRWSAEDEVSEADIISLSEGEESVSGLDFRSREQDELIPKSKAGEDLFPSHVDKPQQDQVDEKQIQREQNESLVNKFSDTLLKEAASQMIAILKAKQAKFPESHKGKSTVSVSTQKGAVTEDEPHSEEESPLSSPRNNRFMAVQRFPDGVSNYLEDTATPPGSPTEERRASIDEKELTDKLDQLRRLHEHLDSSREETLEEDDSDRLEFKVHTNEMIEFPAEEEDEEEFRLRSRAASFLFSVPHHPSEVSPVVASSLSVFFDRKRRGLPIGSGSPPSEIIGEDKADDDLESNSKRVYRRLVFDLSGNILKELLSEEVPPSLPPWMKAKRRRKRRLHRGLNPLVREKDYLPVVEQQVLNLIGLGDARPSLDRVRRKTPLKAGKKDFVDAILIQELREDEPLWIDYDDDELAVKFQVADAIFESLLSETVMVLNAVQMRREARADAYGS